ncbi:telomere-associated protein RIF1 isoform X2 [Pseudomyrmex gracilis]|uniref:telomere-associated protein RIF1 isoform X2 n=1 Tax=Pseudomyrmex gracilis TaxID=219809 RepID=UPI000994DB34|nr:telomere-associated protein RIF1 isoform X2 [Pseudomyrmex gracilis]
MATILGMTFPKMLKTLRENGNVKEKREVLTYISSQAKKLELSGVIKEERYKDLCKVVVEAFTKHEGNLQNEALRALTVIVQEFKTHSLHLFEAMLQTDKKTRLKILKLLEVVEDNAVTEVVNDDQAVNFFKDCLQNVQPSLMEWIKPTACVDNLDMLTRVEQQIMSDEQKLEEDVINYSLSLLKRLYKLASMTFDQNIHRFDELLLDKIVMLAYMGHKRQRVSALRVLQQAVVTNSSSYIYKEYPQLWTQYKNNLQSVYCKRMLLLVSACEADWALQWNTTIQFLGTDLHCGASFINNLLSVEEKAFKSTDPIIRRQAFLSWKLLIDNFALDHQELATPRRIKLLCIPLNAKNSKTELIALTKLEVWWHLIIKLYKDIAKFATPVITQFLNYCFGPLGDTPLLSFKFDVVASPGKRFLKTKVVAVDALCQLVVKKEDLIAVCAPMLEERLPHPISDEVFQECTKSVIHSIGEALLILGQLTDQEMKNSFQLGKKLWTNLLTYISNTKLETKDHLYRDVILVITELGNHTDKQMIKLMIFNVILPDIIKHIVNKVEGHDNILSEMVLKLLSIPVFKEVPKLIPDYYNTVKCLLTRCISLKEFPHSKGLFDFLETAIQHVNATNDLRNKVALNLGSITPSPKLNLWVLMSEIVTKFLATNSDISEHDKFFKTVKKLLSLPFQHSTDNHAQLQTQITTWKALYKQFESHPALTVTPNRIVLDISSMMRNFLIANKCCYTFVINCLDVLLESFNYMYLLGQDEIPPILQLILDIVTISFNDIQNTRPELALKTLTTILNGVYNHNIEKTILYLHCCRPTIEFILTSRIKGLSKEITTMWKCIISIFKGLKQQLNHELLLSYKMTFVAAMCHPNSDIKSATQSVFEIKDGLNNKAKSALEEIKEAVEKSASHSKSDIKKKQTTEGAKEDYVYIKTELKFDVNRLTEHQKETLKKKREDIPALYNDLSQSSSQNSQNLQEWFDIKAKHINELDKNNGKTNGEANKENKGSGAQTSEELTDMVAKLVDNIVNNIHKSKSEESNVENIISPKQNKELTKESKKDDSNEERVKRTDTPKQINLSVSVASSSKQNISLEKNEETNTLISVAKKLNFECREEYPEQKIERSSSPSMLDSTKRRRSNVIKVSSSSKNEEIEKEKDPTNFVHNKTLRDIQGKPGASNKQSSLDDSDIKDGDNRKGVKRKSTSDTESDVGIMQRRKRKSTGGETSQSSDNVPPDISISQRTKNEMSRLKIDMVFDCNSANRRRVKHLDDEKETSLSGVKKSDQAKRRRKTITKQTNKSNSDVVEKSDDNADKDSEISSDASTTTVSSTSNQEVQDVTINKIQDKKIDEENLESVSSEESAELPESNEKTRDDVEDVVESSQVPRSGSLLDKLCSEKQCFIKIKKVTNVTAIKTSDTIAEKDYVPESTLMDYENDVPESSEQQTSENNSKDNVETNDEENKDGASTDPIQEIDHSITKSTTVVSENQKTLDNLSSSKFSSIYSSPKSTGKVFSKSKSFTGRAAHMLGLVTKQSLIESDLTFDDESIIRRARPKDAENETSASKKMLAVKEIDKIGGPSGSRQEKMFSNMRSVDYSPSRHTFATLKNDGEKLSYKLEKIMSESSSSIETSVDKETEKRVSPSREKSDLPILEWSSANPPSLTASPSASILKRQRSSVSELDSDSTPNKRKRVSFADPPVSKEMGYEISATESPQKPFKYSTSHSPMLRRDSPFRFKQSRLKPLDVEKITVENDAQPEGSSEIASETEKKESPMKKSETSFEIMNVDEQVSSNAAKSDSTAEINFRAKIIVDENLESTQEVEVTTNSAILLIQENKQISPSEDSANIADVATEDSETQDIFDTRSNTPPICTNDDAPTKDDSANSIKLDVTNDSVIAALSTKDDTPNMEDTIDVANITGLTSVNTDEIFCGKLIRTSTQEMENIAEQDTLLVTDSLFESLSSVSQETDNNVDLDPEYLNSTQPIYPTLSSCEESINSILGQLTYPSWTGMLGSYLENRSVRTIGDLAQLSEREINRLPLKSKSKISLVKGALQHFENKSVSQAKDNSSNIEDSPSLVEETTIVATTSDVEAASVTTESLNSSTSLNQSVFEKLDDSLRKKSSTEQIDETDSLTSDMEVSPEHVFVKKIDSLVSATSTEDVKTSTKVSIIAEDVDSPRTCTDNAKSMSFSAFENTDLSRETSSTSASVDVSQVSIEPSRVYDELLITHSSIGTNTDEVNLSTPTVQKATRSVESQMALEELLDEIDVNLVLESAVRRCTPEALMTHYKGKMGLLSESDLIKETLKMLCLQNTQRLNDASLRAACHACGLNKVLLRLPDIFSNDKQFFDKVLNVYSKKLNLDNCLNIFDFNEVKKTVSQKCTSSELVEMLSEKLKEEEKEGIKQPMPELSSLDAMLQRLPMDVIISHTVANEELIPASVVLDIALQNNSSEYIAQALKQSPTLAKHVFDKLWSSQFALARIDNDEVSKRSLLNIFKSVSSKLTEQELLDAYYEAMSKKHLKSERE